MSGAGTADSAAGLGMREHKELDRPGSAVCFRQAQPDRRRVSVEGGIESETFVTPNARTLEVMLPLGGAALSAAALNSEWGDLLEAKPGALSVSLVASVSGESLGAVALRSEAQSRTLRALLASAHDRGHCIRSTVEFCDGDVAGSAEGELSVQQTSKSSYVISHNFLELNRLDAGVTLSFEDTPDHRIVIEGPSIGACIHLEPCL